MNRLKCWKYSTAKEMNENTKCASRLCIYKYWYGTAIHMLIICVMHFLIDISWRVARRIKWKRWLYTGEVQSSVMCVCWKMQYSLCVGLWVFGVMYPCLRVVQLESRISPWVAVYWPWCFLAVCLISAVETDSNWDGTHPWTHPDFSDLHPLLQMSCRDGRAVLQHHSAALTTLCKA